ncbi:MAG: UDP-N-acetylmuramate dehydrogenase [Candidatus Babeliales bacterium]
MNKPSFIKTSTSLRDKNWFQTGGPARFFGEPTTIQEFQQALIYADKQQLDIFILGQGANILVSDDGFDGLVIRPQITDITQEQQEDAIFLTAGAGVIMHNLIDYCLTHNILGLEEFSGIPGTVGGSIYINLHYFKFLLAQFLVSAQVINKHTGRIKTVDNSWFSFGYNYSTLHQHNNYLINATFKLKHASDIETAYAKGRRKEIIRHRITRYPSTHTCGSFFRNFYENEIVHEVNQQKIIFVAYYLDKIGVKGMLRHGNAAVSYQHANMIVNTGNASSTDIINVAKEMQDLVKKQFGLIPQPECQLIGFKHNPLR